MRKILLTTLCLCLFVLCGCNKQQAQQAGPMGPPVMPVTVGKATQESVPTEVHVVGTVEASEMVQVKSQIAGPLLKVTFTEGSTVQKGDLLFQIDPRPFQEALNQAESAVERDRAMVAQAEATLARDAAQVRFAESDAARQEQLNKENLASKMVADQARTNLEVTRATVRASEAAVNTSRAALNSDLSAVTRAKLSLSYCEIHAPISGRTGNLLVHAGNLVKENDVPLVVINQTTPVFVNFGVPEDHLGAIRRLDAAHRLVVKAALQDGSNRSATGSLAVIDNTVDASTGTIRLKATFENRDALLWPASLWMSPSRWILFATPRWFPPRQSNWGSGARWSSWSGRIPAWTCGPSPRALPAPLRTHRTVIEKGVAPGETVVTDGQMAPLPGRQSTYRRGAYRGSGKAVNISHIFIERPIMTVLVCLSIVLFGVVAFRALPVAALPSVDYPTIQVNAALPGAPVRKPWRPPWPRPSNGSSPPSPESRR